MPGAEGEAGSVPGNVESGADAFFGIELDLRWRLARATEVSCPRQGGKTAFLASPFLFIFFEFVIGPLFRSERKIRKGLAAQGGIDEKNDQQGESDRASVNDASNPLPAGLPGIVKDLLSH